MSDSFDNAGVMGRAWFKLLVGAWFALLLGGGLWLMPPNVHTLIARSTGLAGLHPMFAPPVSPAGVAALSGIVALFGLFLGLAIAARLAAATAPRAFAPGFEPQDDVAWQEEGDVEEFEQPRRRRVFSAREDIGEEGIAISAPREVDTYEEEYTLEETPAAAPEAPEKDFDAVYAEMEGGYSPEVDDAHAAVDEEGGTDGEEGPAEYELAEFEELGDDEAPAFSDEMPVAYEPETPERGEETPAGHAALDTAGSAGPAEAMGDMSLDALLGRLEGALEAHKSLVARSEEAARQPAPEPIPMLREPVAEDDMDEDGGLPEASEDDPVIAFLRREASRRMPVPPAHEQADRTDGEGETASESAMQSQTEAQAALRSALDRLGQVNRRD